MTGAARPPSSRSPGGRSKLGGSGGSSFMGNYNGTLHARGISCQANTDAAYNYTDWEEGNLNLCGQKTTGPAELCVLANKREA